MDINFYFSCKVFAYFLLFFFTVDLEFIDDSIFYFIVRPDSVFFFFGIPKLLKIGKY